MDSKRSDRPLKQLDKHTTSCQLPINRCALTDPKNQRLCIPKAVSTALTPNFSEGYLVEFTEADLKSYHQPRANSTVVFATLIY